MSRSRSILLTVAALCCTANGSTPSKSIKHIDLSKPFGLPRGASFEAFQGADVEDPVGVGDSVPGEIHLCVRVPSSQRCEPDLDAGQRRGEPDLFDSIHFLQDASIVYPRGRS